MDEQIVTGKWAVKMQKKLGLNRHQFWKPGRVKNKSTEKHYDEETHKIPDSVKVLMYMHYVLGLPVNSIKDMETAARLYKLGDDKIFKQAARLVEKGGK